MLDLVLLFAFADEPATYIHRTCVHRMLPAYQALAAGRTGSLDSLLQWYDDELLWRLLVYGGNLLRGRESRNQHWAGVCNEMLPDLVALLA
jgi:hypothetical protein